MPGQAAHHLVLPAQPGEIRVGRPDLDHHAPAVGADDGQIQVDLAAEADDGSGADPVSRLDQFERRRDRPVGIARRAGAVVRAPAGRRVLRDRLVSNAAMLPAVVFTAKH